MKDTSTVTVAGKVKPATTTSTPSAASTAAYKAPAARVKVIPGMAPPTAPQPVATGKNSAAASGGGAAGSNKKNAASTLSSSVASTTSNELTGKQKSGGGGPAAAAAIASVSPPQPPVAAISPAVEAVLSAEEKQKETDRKEKALRKKLKMIEELKERRAAGTLLDTDQVSCYCGVSCYALSVLLVSVGSLIKCILRFYFVLLLEPRLRN